MYAVIELQKLNESTLANIVAAYQNLNEAKSRYHTILAAAALSEVPVHTAVIVSDNGNLIASECFIHETEPTE